MKYGKGLIHKKKPAATISPNWQSTSSVSLQTQLAANAPLATWGLFTQVAAANWGLRRFARQPWWKWISSKVRTHLEAGLLHASRGKQNFTPHVEPDATPVIPQADSDHPDIGNGDDLMIISLILIN